MLLDDVAISFSLGREFRHAEECFDRSVTGAISGRKTHKCGFLHSGSSVVGRKSGLWKVPDDDICTILVAVKAKSTAFRPEKQCFCKLLCAGRLL